MDDFVFTERGKIIIAVVIVLLLLLLPSAILLFKSLAAQPSTPTSSPGTETSGDPPPTIAETPPHGIENSPPPPGGGSLPPDDPPAPVSTGEPPLNGIDEPGWQGEGGPTPSQPPERIPGSVDPVRGTLSFSFLPDYQNSLDTETLAILGAFISSPKNTRDSLIVVEMPQMPDKDAEKLTTAVVNAFAAQGIGEQRLVFSTRQYEMTGGLAEVALYYSAQQTK